MELRDVSSNFTVYEFLYENTHTTVTEDKSSKANPLSLSVEDWSVGL